MSVPVTLAQMYDGDMRATNPAVAALAADVPIPHPLHGVQYADGADRCTHARACQTVTGGSAR